MARGRGGGWGGMIGRKKKSLKRHLRDERGMVKRLRSTSLLEGSWQLLGSASMSGPNPQARQEDS